MKPIRYYNASKPSFTPRRKGGGVYLVSCRNGGDMGYHFVVMPSQGAWMSGPLHATRSELLGGLGKVVASCSGVGPIQHLKQQMNETALS